jgi:hypothetical protein
MNADQQKRLFQLFAAKSDDSITEAEHEELTQALRDDAEARRLWFVHQDVELGLRTQLKAVPLKQPNPKQWLQWRPLTAAAAGIVFGMFCTSVVFGFVAQRGFEKKTPLAVEQPSFEDAQMPLAKGFPDAAAHWGGDAAQVVTAENGVRAKEGKFMLRLEASPRGSPRFVYQVLDLTSLPSSAGGEMREIEISASFAAADVESSMRCMLRAFAVSEAREHLDAAWIEHRDEAMASASRGLDVTPESQGWKTLSLKIQVPRAARSLVLFFGVRTPDKTLPKAAHYLDDVQVSLIEPSLLP